MAAASSCCFSLCSVDVDGGGVEEAETETETEEEESGEEVRFVRGVVVICSVYVPKKAPLRADVCWLCWSSLAIICWAMEAASSSMSLLFMVFNACICCWSSATFVKEPELS